MSLSSDLLAAFAEPYATVPVACGAATCRGIFDQAGALQKLLGVEVQSMSVVLYIVSGALGQLTHESLLTVGAVGAPSAVGGVVWRIADFEPIEDGSLTAIALAGGPA